MGTWRAMPAARTSELGFSTRERRRHWLATLVAILLGAGLRWPVLQTPLHSDDFQQLAMLRGAFVLRRPIWDLFWFGPGSAAEWQRLVAFGFDPWWTSPDHRLSMFRPLSSLLIAFDASLFGSDAVLCHLHSLLWWVALVISVALLFARILPPAVAAAAVLLFALDQAHDVPLSWLANRSTLVAATFGVLALLAHLRARDHGLERGWWLLSGLLWALSLAAGEYAFGLIAYVLAFECLQARDRLARRLLAVAPALALAGLYLVLRAALGIGVGGSGLYVGPGEPARYLFTLLQRAPVLASDVLLGVPAGWWQNGAPWRDFVIGLELLGPEGWSRLPSWQSAHVVVGVLALACAWLALHFVTRHAAREQASVRFMLLGSMLALGAAVGAEPSARLLIAPELGAATLLATLLVHAARLAAQSHPQPPAQPQAHAWSRTRYALLGCAIVLVHGVIAARIAYAHTADSRLRAQSSLRWALDAPIPRDATQLDIVIVAATDFATAANLPWLRWFYGLPLPHSYRRLSGAIQAHDLRRLDDHSIEIDVLSSDVSDAFAGTIYRTRDEPLLPGQRVQLPGMEVLVVATAQDGNPWRLHVRFERALDDPKLLWLHARPEGLRRIAPPRAGETLRLPRAATPWQRFQ
jgi:hypothetical protein